MEGDDCLGVETLCVFEVQTFHARGTGLEGGTLLLKASAEEVTTTELVAEATGGMVHTKGGCGSRRYVIVCIFLRASFSRYCLFALLFSNFRSARFFFSLFFVIIWCLWVFSFLVKAGEFSPFCPYHR